MPKAHKWVNPVFEKQADATLNQANPVSGTKYTILNTVRNVRIYSVAVKVTWTVQPTPLEIHFTVDGQTWLTSIANPVSGTAYQPTKGTAAYTFTADFQMVTATISSAYLTEGRSVKIEAETTGGTVQNLSGRVKYGRIPDA